MRTEIASVGDPRHFGKGPDADSGPRIRTCDMRISEAQKHLHTLLFKDKSHK